MIGKTGSIKGSLTMKNKRAWSPRSSFALRIVAGLYMFYLVYGMIDSYRSGTSGANKTVVIIAVAFFSICAVIFVVSGVIYFIKNPKMPAADNLPENPDEAGEEERVSIEVKTEEDEEDQGESKGKIED